MSINWNRDNHVRNISQNEHFDFVIMLQNIQRWYNFLSHNYFYYV